MASLKYNKALSLLVAIIFLTCADANCETFEAWMSRLPKRARNFPGADRSYWRLWYEHGFSPEFAWKNTDPKQVHDFARPLLKGERP